jgi:hypothetical protein
MLMDKNMIVINAGKGRINRSVQTPTLKLRRHFLENLSKLFTPKSSFLSLIHQSEKIPEDNCSGEIRFSLDQYVEKVGLKDIISRELLATKNIRITKDEEKFLSTKLIPMINLDVTMGYTQYFNPAYTVFRAEMSAKNEEIYKMITEILGSKAS